MITIIQARVLHLLAGHALTLRLPNAYCGPLAARNDQDPPKPADEQWLGSGQYTGRMLVLNSAI
jgi:hypothetical protein